MSDGMRREFTYLSSHATNRYFIPNWGNNLVFIHTSKVRKKDDTTKQYIMYFNKDIADYQAFINVQLSIFNLLRYLTDFNDIPLIIADRVL